MYHFVTDGDFVIICNGDKYVVDKKTMYTWFYYFRTTLDKYITDEYVVESNFSKESVCGLLEYVYPGHIKSYVRDILELARYLQITIPIAFYTYIHKTYDDSAFLYYTDNIYLLCEIMEDLKCYSDAYDAYIIDTLKSSSIENRCKILHIFKHILSKNILEYLVSTSLKYSLWYLCTYTCPNFVKEVLGCSVCYIKSIDNFVIFKIHPNAESGWIEDIDGVQVIARLRANNVILCKEDINITLFDKYSNYIKGYGIIDHVCDYHDGSMCNETCNEVCDSILCVLEIDDSIGKIVPDILYDGVQRKSLYHHAEKLSVTKEKYMDLEIKYHDNTYYYYKDLFSVNTDVMEINANELYTTPDILDTYNSFVTYIPYNLWKRNKCTSFKDVFSSISPHIVDYSRYICNYNSLFTFLSKPELVLRCISNGSIKKITSPDVGSNA